MRKAGYTIALLSACQVLLATNNVVHVGMTGLVGYAFATDKAWATLPITVYVVGTALATLPASLWMQLVGRRMGFVTGCAIGICGSLLCCLAAVQSSFWMLVAGSFLTGGYNAFGQYYRFAAAEAVEESRKSKAISLVLAGGIGGAILGPEGSKLTKDLLAVPYLGAYVFLVACALIALVLQSILRLPDLDTNNGDVPDQPSRPLLEIVVQPLAIVAVLGAVVGYLIMSLLMTATPLAMVGHQHKYAATAFVIEWHVIAMFAPSFITGSLIQRYGILTIMETGGALMLATIAAALSGTSVPVFWVALVLLGLGWNFLYVGGTTLLTSCYRPSERSKVQGLNDMLVFTGSAAASLLSGLLLELVGWTTIILVTIVPALVILGALGWAWRGRRAVSRRDVKD